MQTIIDFFETIPSWQRALILAGGISFFWILEGIIPVKKMLYQKWKHAGINIFFTLTTVVVNFALAFAMSMSAAFVVDHQFGVFHWLSAPLWLNVIIALLILDFIGAYLIHWLEHKVKLMWRFHLVHHTDTNIDSTTANRHHPGESVFRAAFTSIAIFISGAPFGVVMLYQTVSAFLSQFNHANIKLPNWLDQAISWIIVSPNMHKVHHHYQQPYTDTNYGNIFSVWDRILQTFSKKEIDQLNYGVDTHMQPIEHSDIKNLLTLPFQAYRTPEGSKFSNK
jgi:sterol desaturase/sphingolipid hydroxylase (fatty acid hydroxylase superfamily)